MNLSTFAHLLVFGLAVTSCTKTDRRNERGQHRDQNATQETPAEGGDTQEESGVKVLKLKSSDMLAQSIYAALGPGKTFKREESGEVRDLMFDFRRNFGGTSSLRLGEVYADSPSVAYVLALGIVGMNAGTICQELLTKSDPESANCRCGDEPSAKAMITRALPFLDMKSDEAKAVVSDLAAQCAKDPAGAIGALVSSLAFAARI